jgi:hypothetical protein
MVEFRDKLIIEVILENRGLEKRLESLRKQVNATAKDMGMKFRASSKDVITALNDIEQETMDLHKEQLMTNRAFLQGGLSIMFFGMSMSKTFNSIIKSGMTAFQNMVANTDLANNALNRLTGGFEFLNYTIGSAISDALEPIMPIIEYIIELVADWIEMHPTTSALFLGVGALLGVLMSTVGQVLLLIIGLKTMMGAEAFGSLVAGATHFFAGLLQVAVILLIVKGIIGLLTNDKPVVDFFKTIVVGIAKIFAFIMYIYTEIKQFTTETFKVIGDIIFIIIKWAIAKAYNFGVNKINDLIIGLNKIPGVNIGMMDSLVETDLVSELAKPLTRYANYLNKDFFDQNDLNNWMDGAENVGTMFENGISQISTFLGLNQQNQNGESDNLNINNLLTASETQLESSETFSNSVNLFAQLISDMNANQTTSGTTGFTFVPPATQ